MSDVFGTNYVPPPAGGPMSFSGQPNPITGPVPLPQWANSGAPAGMGGPWGAGASPAAQPSALPPPGAPQTAQELNQPEVTRTSDGSQPNATAATAAGAVGGMPHPAVPNFGGLSSNYFPTVSMKESSNTNVVAPNAASGYYGFMPGTWQGLRKANPGLNLPAIPSDADYNTQTLAAQKLTAENLTALQNAGLPINDKNAYMTHFLGSGAGPKFLLAMQKDPNASAPAMFPQEASQNKSIFYNGSQPRTLQQVYNLQTKDFGNSPGGAQDAGTSPAGTGTGLATLAKNNPLALMGLMQAMAPQYKFTPVSYDPFKVMPKV